MIMVVMELEKSGRTRSEYPKLIELEKQAGFDMLRNEFRIIEKNGEKLYIVGVENWGLPPFPQYGDLDKTTQGIPADAAKDSNVSRSYSL